jgi:hypothetical protein
LGEKSPVDFEYKNGNKDCAIIVPQVKNEDSFNIQAKRLSCVESMLDHTSEKMMLLNGHPVS